MSSLTWKRMEKTRPKANFSLSGMTTNQSTDDSSSDSSQKNALWVKLKVKNLNLVENKNLYYVNLTREVALTDIVISLEPYFIEITSDSM